LSYAEVHKFLSNDCNFGLSNDQATDFTLLLDKDCDGHISLPEFHGNLDKEWKNVVGAAEWLNEARERISQAVTRFDIGLRATFKHFNKSGSGKMDIVEFTNMVSELQLSDFSVDDAEAVFGYLDTDDLKYISSKQFKRAFGEQQPKENKDIESGVIMQQVIKILSEYHLELHKEFRAIDVEGSGTVTVGEFKAVITAANDYLEQKLSETQLTTLFSQLADAEGDGFVLYREFLEECESASRNPVSAKQEKDLSKYV